MYKGLSASPTSDLIGCAGDDDYDNDASTDNACDDNDDDEHQC